MATWNLDLSRAGPGLLLAEIMAGRGAELAVLRDGLAQVAPDVVVLTRIDIDPQGVTAAALQAHLAAAGLPYPHVFAPPQNVGWPSGIDLDGDGRLGRASDAQGYGRFWGDGAVMVLSRWPLELIADHSHLLWRDLQGADLRALPQEALAVQRLSTSGHWRLRVGAAQPVDLLVWAATVGLFDRTGRNAARLQDEARLIHQMVDTGEGVIVVGRSNAVAGRGLDPLMADPRLHPPLRGTTATFAGRAEQLSYLQAGRNLRILDFGFYPCANQPENLQRLLWIGVHLSDSS